jgi:hypothetical protein
METLNKDKGMDFDSSLFFSNLESKGISNSEYESALIDALQPILNDNFSIQAKTKIYKKHNRLSFACPICSDSMTNIYAKRGNFILGGKYAGYFKCWNCDEFMRIDQFFKHYNAELNLNIIEYINNSTQDFATSSNAKYDISLFLDIDTVEEYALDREVIKKLFSAIDIEGTEGERYLKKRLQFRTKDFLYNEKYIIILNLTPNGKVLGAQMRLFKNRKDKYRTYKLSKLYEDLKIEREAPENLDDISVLFGMMSVDIDKPINLFEGPLDAFLIRNSVAIAGAHRSMVLDMNIRYIFDNDKTGTIKAIEHITNSDYVFMWSRYLSDMKAPNKEKWDMNDLFIWAKKNDIKLPLIDKYFSNDPLDILDI